ncbi:serine/threonine-protein kinase pim-1-like [Gigantopelta aegis]|uniref:serine/threonine-protein kinase pim-1-like n=1 Tax=Gigantopelta aegis TaxID=1735272 RepID=UPI001B888E7D|nr:serine/threonine-protein kinase pim-1-like [Gigantopelta aegis]
MGSKVGKLSEEKNKADTAHNDTDIPSKDVKEKSPTTTLKSKKSVVKTKVASVASLKATSSKHSVHSKPPTDASPSFKHSVHSKPPTNASIDSKHSAHSKPPADSSPTLKHNEHSKPPTEASASHQQSVHSKPPADSSPTLKHNVHSKPPTYESLDSKQNVHSKPPAEASPSFKDSVQSKPSTDAGAGSEHNAASPVPYGERDVMKSLYTLGKVLGLGGFGTVYAAHRKSDHRPVAIKLVAKKHVAQWQKLRGAQVPMEVYALHLLQRVTGVILMIDYYPRADDFVIVTERPEGAIDLHEYITENGVPPEETAKDYFYQIVQAVSGIHKTGIFHRDLKLENVLLDDKGVIRIIDFGSAMLLRSTAYKEPLGSRIFSPPEYIELNRYHAEDATVWSLGIVLFSLVIGTIPFHDEDDIMNAEDFVHAQLSFTGGLSRELHRLIRQCLQFNRYNRPSIEGILASDWLLEHTIMIKRKTRKLRNKFMTGVDHDPRLLARKSEHHP